MSSLGQTADPVHAFTVYKVRYTALAQHQQGAKVISNVTGTMLLTDNVRNK